MNHVLLKLSKVLCLGLLVFTQACSSYLDNFLPPPPDQFEWRSGWIKCIGYILSPLSTVDINYENGYVLSEKGIVAISAPRITDYRLQFTATVLQGKGMRIRVRSIAKEQSNFHGIIFDYTVSGIEIRDGNRVICQTDTIKAKNGIEEFITIDSDGKHMRIEIGCAKPIIFTTEQMGTEYIITETLPFSKASLYGIEMLPLRLARPSIY